MKKIYATEIDGSQYDYGVYYDEGSAVEDGIWAGGNDYQGEVNKDLRKDVVSALENAYYDIYEAIKPGVPLKEVVEYYFKKDSKEAFTDTEIKKLVKLIKNFYSCNRGDENDIICEVLTITTGKKYLNGTIKGICQSDWLKIIYPEERKEMIPYIEAVWFATGTEFAITCKSVEKDQLEDVDSYFDYYIGSGDRDDIKKWVAENNHVSVDEVELRLIKDKHIQYIYSYENY